MKNQSLPQEQNISEKIDHFCFSSKCWNFIDLSGTFETEICSCVTWHLLKLNFLCFCSLESEWSILKTLWTESLNLALAKLHRRHWRYLSLPLHKPNKRLDFLGYKLLLLVRIDPWLSRDRGTFLVTWNFYPRGFLTVNNFNWIRAARFHILLKFQLNLCLG